MLKSLLNMALSRVGPLNQIDVYRIVSDFDQDYFRIAKPLRNDQVDRFIVINQFERMLFSHLPIAVVDEIMKYVFEDSHSVTALLMYYKNSPATALHPLPLSLNHCYINMASQSLLVRLEQTPIKGELASYQQLMTVVFTHYFQKLTTNQKLELLRRSHITPWEQKSASQKLELLGRIQAPTTWGKAKLNLQFLVWKVQYAAARALKNQVILWVVGGAAGALLFAQLLLLIARLSSSVAGSTIYKTLNNAHTKAWVCFIILGFAALVTSLISAGVGLALQIPIFPRSVQEKGAWIKSVAWNCFLIALYFLQMVTPNNSSQTNHNNNSFEKLTNASEELQRLLLQSINEANITIEQINFIDAHLPDLIHQWLHLTLPSDINHHD